jgi:hypothetical protein
MTKLISKKIALFLLIDFVLYLLLPLEFGKFQSRNIIYPLLWISIAIIAEQFIPQKKSTSIKIFVTLGVIGYLLISCIMAFGFFMFCGWFNYGAVYKNKAEHSLKLVCKSYECYGTAGDCDLYKRRELLPKIFWVTKFTEAKVDSTIWEKIPFGEGD